MGEFSTFYVGRPVPKKTSVRSLAVDDSDPVGYIGQPAGRRPDIPKRPSAPGAPFPPSSGRRRGFFITPTTGTMIEKLEFESGNFFTVAKEFAEDPDLSPEAKGVLAYLATKPEDWDPRISDIVGHMDCKKYKIRSILEELRIHGYSKREKYRREDGTFDWKTTIADHSKFESTEPSQNPAFENSDHTRSEPGRSRSTPKTNRAEADRGYNKNDSNQELSSTKNERERTHTDGRESAANDPPVSEEKAISLAEEEDVSERVARKWWHHHNARGWDRPIKNVRSALVKWSLNEEDFHSNGDSGVDGSFETAEDLRGETLTEEEIRPLLEQFDGLEWEDFGYVGHDERRNEPLYSLT